MLNFDVLFDESCLPRVISAAKTVSKNECRFIFDYFTRKRPQTVCEFGVHYGCSSRVFLEIAKWLNLDMVLHSWDIKDRRRFVTDTDMIFHLEDITNKVENVILQFKPDFVFLDAHPYLLTKNLMEMCLKHSINFGCHDVDYSLYERNRKETNNFVNTKVYSPWDLYLLSQIISEKLLHNDIFENDKVKAECRRERFGICIVEMKN